MSDVKFEDIQIGDKLLYAEVLPTFGVYNLNDMHITYRYTDPEDSSKDYVSGCEKRTKQRVIFSKPFAEEVLFTDRKAGLTYLKQKQEENKDVPVFKKDTDANK